MPVVDLVYWMGKFVLELWKTDGSSVTVFSLEYEVQVVQGLEKPLFPGFRKAWALGESNSTNDQYVVIFEISESVAITKLNDYVLLVILYCCN